MSHNDQLVSLSAVELRRLIDEGVGGIMTDRPDLLAAALRERA